MVDMGGWCSFLPGGAHKTPKSPSVFGTLIDRDVRRIRFFFKWRRDFTELYNLSIPLGKSPTSAQTPAVTLRWTAMMSSRRQEGPVAGGGM